MSTVVFNKKELIDLIKGYYNKIFFAQAVKVKIKSNLVKSSNSLSNDSGLISNFYVENAILIQGYLENNGFLCKFSDDLSFDDLKNILIDKLGDSLVSEISMINAFKTSHYNDDVHVNFKGVKVVTQKDKAKTYSIK